MNSCLPNLMDCHSFEFSKLEIKRWEKSVKAVPVRRERIGTPDQTGHCKKLFTA